MKECFKKNRSFWVGLTLILIIILGFGLRGYRLGRAPAGLYLDEAAQGYNAYSILKTGKDEFGKAFPIVFRSFTDFKTPVYIYLVAPLIPWFGLTPFTVRLPSFIFSVLTFPVLFFLLKRISPIKIATKISILVVLLLAVSPWHILFGRTNFECNVALFFFLLGLLWFYKGLEKPFFLVLSALMFAVAIPSYHSQRIVTPLVLMVLFLRYSKKLFLSTHRRFVGIGFLLGLLISLPTLAVVGTPGFLARASGLNIFSHYRQMPAGFMYDYQGIWNWWVNSSWFLSTKEFLSLYVSYFSPRNIFWLGDSGPRSSFPELSTFFIWQFPLYVYGLWILIKRKGLGELRFLALILLLVAPIPAAVTRDPYSTIRALPLVIPQLIVIGLGLMVVWERLMRLNRFFYRVFFGLCFLGILAHSVLKLYSSVIILNEHFRAVYWNYGWEQVVRILEEKTDLNLPVIVDNARFEPYSQLLFFTKFDPTTYQRENFEVSLREYYTNMNRSFPKKIGRIEVRNINWKPDLEKEQYLVGDALAISYEQIERHKLVLIAEIFYPDQSPAFRIVKVPIE